MLVLLPPSETKCAGGDGAPLDLATLSFSGERAVARTRSRLVASLGSMSRRPRIAMEALALGPRQRGELQHNLHLATAPTMAALERYTGVLFDAFAPATLDADLARARARERVMVCSALFGLLGAGDLIPAYRLSGTSRLPRLGTLASLWKPALQPVLGRLARDHLLVDLRSGAYRALAPSPDAVTVQVLCERADGSRSVVSHHNKATRGQLARLLVEAPAACQTADDVAHVAAAAGLHVEQPAAGRIDVVLPRIPVTA